MLAKVVKVFNLKDKHAQIQSDLEYWLSRTPEERLSAIEYLRRSVYGNKQRLQKVVKIIQRKKS